MADEDTKFCPFCGGEIKSAAIKCKHCGKMLNEEAKEPVQQTISINLPTVIKYAKIAGISFCIFLIVILLIWVLFFDYPAVARNNENFWYGQYLSSGILHILIAIFAAQVILILKK